MTPGPLPFRTSWQPFTFQRAASFLPFGECPFRHVAGVSRNVDFRRMMVPWWWWWLRPGRGAYGSRLGLASRAQHNTSRSQAHSLSRRIGDSERYENSIRPDDGCRFLAGGSRRLALWQAPFGEEGGKKAVFWLVGRGDWQAPNRE